MTTSANYVALASATPFADRCYFVAFQFAINFVVLEPPGARTVFAKKIIADQIPHGILATTVLTDGNAQAKLGADPNAIGVGAAVLDSDIDGRLQAMWANLAGAGF